MDLANNLPRIIRAIRLDVQTLSLQEDEFGVQKLTHYI